MKMNENNGRCRNPLPYMSVDKKTMLWAKAIPFQGFWAFIMTLSTKIEKKKPQKKQHKTSLFHNIFDFGAP